MTQIQFTVHAYLFAHNDNIFAKKTESQFFKLKRRSAYGSRVAIFMAFDDGNVCQFSRVEAESQEDKTTAKGTSLVDRVGEFLAWTERRRNDAGLGIPGDAPRILMFSSHGIAGAGLSSGEREALLNGGLDSILDSNPWNSPVDPLTLLPVRKQLEQKGLTRIAELEFDELIDSLKTMAGIRRSRSLLETGLTLMAAGPNEPDRLSVRQLVRIVNDLQQRHSNLQYDVTVLQACSLGIPEIPYELNSVTSAVLLCPIFLQGALDMEFGLSEVAAEMKNRPSTSFGEMAARQLLFAEERDRAGICRSPKAPTSLMAVRTGSGWQRLGTELRKFSQLILDQFDSNEPEIRSVLQNIQEQLVCGSTGGCACELCDLRFLATELSCAFSEFRDLSLEISRAQESVLIGRFVHREIARDCRSHGFALYLPREHDLLLDSYTENDPDGFSLLAVSNWRAVLDRYLT